MEAGAVQLCMMKWEAMMNLGNPKRRERGISKWGTRVGGESILALPRRAVCDQPDLHVTGRSGFPWYNGISSGS